MRPNRGISSLFVSLIKERLWVNPDCGLKTRGWPETRSAPCAGETLHQKHLLGMGLIGAGLAAIDGRPWTAFRRRFLLPL